MTHALTTAARRRLESAMDEAGDKRAAQLADTPRQPGDPVIRLTKGQDDE